MNGLFPELTFPPGFSYEENFISTEEEFALIELIQKIPLKTFIFHGYEAKRRVTSFGYDYHFTSRSITKGDPIPKEFDSIVTRVAKVMKVSPDKVAEVLVTEYPIGSVINWHRDAPPFDKIAGISLGTDCIFKLRPYNSQIRRRNETVSIVAHRRSLYVIDKESRSDWEHSISPVKNIRYSITFRTLKEQV